MEENNLNVTPSNKQGNTGLGIIIGLLIAAVVGLSAFIVYDKVIKKDDTNKETTIESTPTPKTVEEKELSVDSDLVKKLSKVVGFVSYETSKYDALYKNDKTNLADLSLEFKLSLVATRTMDRSLFTEDTSKADPNNGYSGTSYVSEDAIKEAYKNVFGVNNDYKRGTFNRINDCSSDYSWSEANNRYEALIPDGCGGSTCWRINYKIDSAKEIGNKIELYQQILVESDCDGYKLTSDFNKTNVLTTTMPTDDSSDNLFKLYGDKAGIYKYTFVKDSAGIYVFTSVEKVK